MKNANLDAKNISPMIQERLNEVDHLVEIIHTLEDENLVDMNLPNRDDYIYSLCMMKEKHKYVSQMKHEF